MPTIIATTMCLTLVFSPMSCISHKVSFMLYFFFQNAGATGIDFALNTLCPAHTDAGNFFNRKIVLLIFHRKLSPSHCHRTQKFHDNSTSDNSCVLVISLEMINKQTNPKRAYFWDGKRWEMDAVGSLIAGCPFLSSWKKLSDCGWCSGIND